MSIPGMDFPTHYTWRIGAISYACEVHPEACVFCGKRAIVALPPPIVSQQPDDTTAVCHPLLGGCNHGFAANVGHTEGVHMSTENEAAPIMPKTGPLAGWNAVGPFTFERCDGGRVERDPASALGRCWRALLPPAYLAHGAGLASRELRNPGAKSRRAARYSSASGAAHALNTLAPERGCYACNASASGVRAVAAAETDLDTVPPVCRPEPGTVAPAKLAGGKAYLFACDRHRERWAPTGELRPEPLPVPEPVPEYKLPPAVEAASKLRVCVEYTDEDARSYKGFGVDEAEAEHNARTTAGLPTAAGWTPDAGRWSRVVSRVP